MMKKELCIVYITKRTMDVKNYDLSYTINHAGYRRNYRILH